MKDQPKTISIPVELSVEQRARLDSLSQQLDEWLIEDARLTHAEHLCLLVLLSLHFIDSALLSAPEGEVTVESLASSIQSSIVRTWKKTHQRRDQ